MLDTIKCLVTLRGACNYSCCYCVGDGSPRTNAESVLHNLDAVKEYYAMMLAAADCVATGYHCRGTEPVIHPQFSQLLAIALNAGTVGLRTNLSMSISKWAPPVLKRLHIMATLHPEAEEDLEGFTTRALEAIDAGAGVKICYIAHPSQAHKMEQYCDHFARAGIPFASRAFRQRAARGTKRRVTETKIADERLCTAGWKTVAIGEASGLYRCVNRKTRMEQVLAGPATCCWPCRQVARALTHDGKAYVGFTEGSLKEYLQNA